MNYFKLFLKKVKKSECLEKNYTTYYCNND